MIVSSSVCQLHHITQCSNSTCTFLYRSEMLWVPYHLSSYVATAISSLCSLQALVKFLKHTFLLIVFKCSSKSTWYNNLHTQLLPPHHTLELTGKPLLLHCSINFDLQTLIDIQTMIAVPVACSKVCNYFEFVVNDSVVIYRLQQTPL